MSRFTSSLGLLIFTAIGTNTATLRSDVPSVLDSYTRGGRGRRVNDVTAVFPHSGETNWGKEGTTHDSHRGAFRTLTTDPSQIHDPYSSTMDSALVDKLNGFGLRLFARLASSSSSSTNVENVVISPTSISTALTMLSLATTEGSDAESEMLALFGGERGFASPSSSTNGGGGQHGIQLEVANSAWVAGDVLESYKQIIRTELDAQIFPPPGDVSEVNDWVKEKTHGEIPTILQELPQALVALLINAVFFKAPWTYKFNATDTLKDELFFGPRGKFASHEEIERNMKRVDMMQMKGQNFSYGEVSIPAVGRNGTTANRLVQIVELPYGPEGVGEYSATFLVPSGPDITLSDILLVLNDNTNNAVTSVWNEWMGATHLRQLEVVAVPRFRIDYGVKEIDAALQGMGMTSVFHADPSNPSLLRMTTDPSVFVSDVLHRSTLECTEEGTTAAAATAVVIVRGEAKDVPPSVELNRPFLMAIRNRSSGAIIFMAKVEDPTGADT